MLQEIGDTYYELLLTLWGWSRAELPSGLSASAISLCLGREKDAWVDKMVSDYIIRNSPAEDVASVGADALRNPLVNLATRINEAQQANQHILEDREKDRKDKWSKVGGINRETYLTAAVRSDGSFPVEPTKDLRSFVNANNAAVVQQMLNLILCQILTSLWSLTPYTLV